MCCKSGRNTSGHDFSPRNGVFRDTVLKIVPQLSHRNFQESFLTWTVTTRKLLQLLDCYIADVSATLHEIADVSTMSNEILNVSVMLHKIVNFNIILINYPKFQLINDTTKGVWHNQAPEKKKIEGQTWLLFFLSSQWQEQLQWSDITTEL